jgi:hypothetical protein
MRKYAEIKIPRRFKTIVTTSAGYPLDKTYYQTVKGMVGVMDILEPGGTIIIASECSEGMGSREFAEAQRLLCQVGPERFMNMLEGRDKALIDEWETEMLLKPLRVGSIQLYSGLDPNETCSWKRSFVKRPWPRRARFKGEGIAVVPRPYVIPPTVTPKPEIASDCSESRVLVFELVSCFGFVLNLTGLKIRKRLICFR